MEDADLIPLDVLKQARLELEGEDPLECLAEALRTLLDGFLIRVIEEIEEEEE